MNSQLEFLQKMKNYYHIDKHSEKIIQYRGREVLVKQATNRNAPHAYGEFPDDYVIVPGYLIKENVRKKDGMDISQVNPIHEKEKMEELEKIIWGHGFKGPVFFRRND